MTIDDLTVERIEAIEVTDRTRFVVTLDDPDGYCTQAAAHLLTTVVGERLGVSPERVLVVCGATVVAVEHPPQSSDPNPFPRLRLWRWKK